MLTIKNFSKSYTGFPVLHIPEMQLSAGVYWIRGENGSGKTTLFKSIAGLLPSQGDIYFDDGISLHRSAIEFRKRVNYSEAEPSYPDFLTAKDLVFFISKAKGSSLIQPEELIETLGLQGFYNNPCSSYSSGMLKKVSLALAFLGTPKVILLDEPLITLDENARVSLYKIIQKFIGKHTTFLVSSHQEMDKTFITLAATYEIRNKQLVSA